MKVLVTGGCGFIGANFVEYLVTNPEMSNDVKVVNLDKQTYAGRGKNIEHLGLDKHPRYRFVRGDICDRALVERLFEEEKPDLVFNFAAESHVDRSITSPVDFVATNVFGTVNLLEASRKRLVERFVQISTDEVYGSITQGSFDEQARLDPSSPYSASKASAELHAIAYFRTFGVPVTITRSANNFGPYQFPEKLLPLFITNLIQRRKVPLMWTPENPGLNVRDWLHVKDNCRAIWHLSRKGELGEVYNIPGENERTNTQITQMLLNYFDCGEEMVEHVEHRKAHDFRYSIDGRKLMNTGFQYTHHDLAKEISELCKWYKENSDWWRPLKK
jgi:dTDP-glucose 4,6-dehydratase